MPSTQVNKNGGEQDANIPIAIVAMACRFPGDATSPAKFYEMLSQGRDAWSKIPEDRFNAEAYWHPNNGRSGTMTAKGAHFMTQDIKAFDAPFFSMSAAEAVATDPQLRMLLEVTYESMESGGIPMDNFNGSNTSCYVGCSSADYNAVAGRDIDDVPLYQAVGGGNAMLSNRISYFYNLKGPSLTLDTACSSGLIALHLGCQSIRNGESRTSLIAASQLILIPDMMTSLSSLHFLSPDSRCYSFDERANGYSRGEGICVMILKKLEDALADGDTIRAVIRGSGTNQDGKTPAIVQPSSEAQADLIRSTYKNAGIDYSQTAMFECHGPGTPVGDPIECAAVGATIGAGRDPTKPLYIGSVKTNVGHLEGCAGLAGLVKTVLCLENAVIVPSLNYENPNPRLRLEEWNLKVPTELTAWPTHGLRRASINAFGYGGSNAHCILDDAYHYLKLRGLDGHTNTVAVSALTPPDTPDEDVDSGHGSMSTSPGTSSPRLFSETALRPRLIVLSAPDQNAVPSLAKAYSGYLHSNIKKSVSDTFLPNFAYTLGNRRTLFPWRVSWISSSATELATTMTHPTKAHRAGKAPKIVFVFTGQGAQWHAMGRELLAYEVFSDTITEADEYLRDLGAEWSVLEELTASEEVSRINLAKFSQPLCVILQIALVNLLQHWQIMPTAVIGHSSGEIAAAYAAGALSAKDCYKIAYHRGRLSAEIKNLAPELNGAMMAVGLSEQDIQAFLAKLPSTDTVVVACINSPSNVTISGDSKALDRLEDLLKLENIFARKLRVGNAYHSPHMQTIAENYFESIETVKTLHPKSAPAMLSSVTGAQIWPAELDASYWVRNMVSPVQFVKACETILIAPTTGTRRRRRDALTADTILEIGPHSALAGPLKQILKANGKDGKTTYISVLSRGQDAVKTTLEAAGKLWTMGQHLDILRVNSTEVEPLPLIALPELPSYTWNHSHKFWHETSLSMNHRFTKTPRLDLVGKRVDDFNVLNPRWMNTIRLSELPWLADHKVQGDILFPAAGMLCGVLEGVQQLADETKTIQAYEFRDIVLNRALVIPSDNEKITMAYHIQPRKIGTKANDSAWHEFTVYSQSNHDDHIEHCSGLIQVQYSTDKNEDEVTEAALEWKKVKEDYSDCQLVSKHIIRPKDFYERLKYHGIQYGPVFQPITKVSTDQAGSGCITIVIPDTKAVMPAQFEYEKLIHPATLDGIFQAYFSGCLDNDQAMLPTSFDSITISAHQPKGVGAEYHGFTRVSRKGFRNYIGHIYVTDETGAEAKISIKGMGCTELGLLTEEVGSSKKMNEIRKMCFELQWKRNIAHVSQSDAETLFQPTQSVDTEYQVACEKAATIYMKRTIAGLTPGTEAAMAPHLGKYVDWMRKRLSEIQPPSGDTMDEEAFLAEISGKYVDGQMLCAVGKNLPSILDGTAAPLPIMMEDNMLFNYHTADPATSMMAKWLELQGYKRPDYRILELGASTGATTLAAFEVLGGRHGVTSRCSRYCFTDTNPGVFEAAQHLLKDWQTHIEYKKFDIEVDPIEQGFMENSFDVIIAANVLHGTKNVENSLRNCYKLLSHGGKLVLGEITQLSDRSNFVLGSLPNWWLFEDGRKGCPLLDEAAWNTQLQAAGFTGLDISVKDTPDNRTHSSSVMVATKQRQLKYPFKKIVVIDAASPSEAAMVLSDNIAKDMEELGFIVEHATLDKAVSVEHRKTFVSGKGVISLLEVEKPMVYDFSEKDFNAVKKVILDCATGLWISRGGRQVEPSGDPSYCATTGLLRVCRCEMPEIRMHEFSFSTKMNLSSKTAADLVSQFFQSMYDEDLPNLETETVELDGHLYIPRLIDEKHKNYSLQTIGLPPQPQLGPFSQPGRPLRLDIGNPGMLDTLQFVDDPTPLAPLKETEVEVEVFANAMNFVDIMVSMGLVADTVLGADAAGAIKRVGSKVTLVKPGDRVSLMGLGAYRNLIRTDERLVQILPENMTYEEGATIPCVYITAYQSLVEIGRLSEGQSILIHSAAGGLGQAAIQLAKHLGAEIFVTAGSVEKRRLLMDEYGIQPDHVFNSRDLDFAKGIMRVTNGKGVDVVLNSLSGEALRKTWECIADYGKFLEVGKRDILGNSGLEMMPFLRNVTFAGVNIEHMSRHNPQMMGRVFKNVFDLIRKGAIGLVKPITVYKYSDMEKAFRLMQQAKHMGKIVIKVNPDDMVPVLPKNSHPLVLDPKATYLLVGGSGGLGRAMSTFLAEHGAKHLAILSRSGSSKQSVKDMITELRNIGVDIHAYACDITSFTELQKTMTLISAEMPHIKGIIHAAMVLNDKYFTDMNYDHWTETTRPKIQGSWNLHQLAPKDLDFFLMLASISGISGNGSQANYAAGNTYQDGLAHYRRSLGLTACALDLGAMSGIGWMAENVNIAEEYRADFERISVQPHEFFSLIESALRGYTYSGQEHPFPTQMVTGAGTGGIGQQMEHLVSSNVFDDPKYHYIRRLDVKSVAHTGVVDGASNNAALDLKTSLTAATTLAQAAELIEHGLALKLSKALSVAVEDIDTSKPVHSYGVDSLVAIEVRNWIFKELKSQVSVFEILSKISMVKLAERIAGKSLFVSEKVRDGGVEGGDGGGEKEEEGEEEAVQDADGNGEGDQDGEDGEDVEDPMKGKTEAERMMEAMKPVEKVEVKELEVKELEVKELEVKELEVKELEVKELEVKELEVKELEVKELEVKELEVAAT